jgi:hypothetical protein
MNSKTPASIIKTSFFIALLISGNLCAQDSQNSTFQTWSSFNFVKNLPFSAVLTINPEVNRLITGGSPWHSYSIDNNLEYYPNNSWDIFASLQLSYTMQEEDINSLEIRPYIGARWNILKPEKRVFLYLQGKYDFRFFHYYGDLPDKYSGRFRIKPEIRISLNRESNLADKNLMLRLSGEYFIQIDEKVKERFLSRHLMAVGFYYRHSHAWRYEFRYQLYRNKNTIEATLPTSTDHVAYFIVTWFL